MRVLATLVTAAAALTSNVRISDGFAKLVNRHQHPTTADHVVSPVEAAEEAAANGEDDLVPVTDDWATSGCIRTASSGLRRQLPVDTQEEKLPTGRCSASVGRCAAGFLQLADPAALPQLADDRTEYRNFTLHVSQASHAMDCVVSHKHQFVFVHVLKNGGSTTQAFLQKAACGDGQECDPCVLEYLSCETVVRDFAHYTRFSWVRHPYDRAVSIWSMAVSQGIAQAGFEELPLRDFWLKHAAQWLHAPYTSDVTWLSATHAFPQAAFLTSTNGCLAADFLGYLDSSKADIGRFFDVIGAQELKAYLDEHGFENEDHFNDYGAQEEDDQGMTAREMIEADPEVKSVIDAAYREDFALLGDCN